MRMLPSPSCALAGQSIFGQNVVCGSMTHLPSALSTEECHAIRSLFQVQSSYSPFSVHLPLHQKRVQSLRFQLPVFDSILQFLQRIPFPDSSAEEKSKPQKVRTVFRIITSSTHHPSRKYRVVLRAP